MLENSTVLLLLLHTHTPENHLPVLLAVQENRRACLVTGERAVRTNSYYSLLFAEGDFGSVESVPVCVCECVYYSTHIHIPVFY